MADVADTPSVALTEIRLDFGRFGSTQANNFIVEALLQTSVGSAMRKRLLKSVGQVPLARRQFYSGGYCSVFSGIREITNIDTLDRLVTVDL